MIRRNYPSAIANRFDAPVEEEASVVGCLCTPLDRLADNRKRFKGELAGTEDGQVGINIEGEAETTLYIPFQWILEAKLVLDDKLMKHGAEERAARLQTEDTEQEP